MASLEKYQCELSTGRLKPKPCKRSISLSENATHKRRICFQEVIRFQKMSTFLYTRLAAELRLADEEFLQVTVNSEEFLK
jgi:hypothetical protein